MKHTIREHIIDPVRGKIVKVSTINAELGTGILDKNGREIFEGDIVHFVSKVFGEDFTAVVCFMGGQFIFGTKLLTECDSCQLEIVGHVGD